MPAKKPNQNSTAPHESKSDHHPRRRGKTSVDRHVACPRVTRSSLLFALVFALPACGGEATPAASSASGAPAASSASAASGPAAAKVATTVEKVSMNGVSWEVTMPADLHKPQYPVKNPEYLGDGDATLALSNTFPKFSSVDSYIERNIATKVLEKKQIGEAHLVIYESQKTGGFSMVAIVPNDTIGWRCSGEMTRAAELRAMCESVKYKKD